jgi:NAD(P)-dependent dehydrogenase (short-subunit alcohol dehydrogenase family)
MVTHLSLRDVLETNLLGPHRVTRAVLPHLRVRGSGLLVFVSSGAGRLTVPGMGVYSASKFGVEALAQAYRYELRSLGIDVTIVQPGRLSRPTSPPRSGWARTRPTTQR